MDKKEITREEIKEEYKKRKTEWQLLFAAYFFKIINDQDSFLIGEVSEFFGIDKNRYSSNISRILENRNIEYTGEKDGNHKLFKLTQEGLKLIESDMKIYTQENEHKQTTIELVRKASNLISEKDYERLLANIRCDKDYLVLDFKDILRRDFNFSEKILNNPDDTIKILESAIEGMDIGTDSTIKVRIKNLPESTKINLSHIRSKDLNQLKSVEGIVRQKSDVRPQSSSSRFECPSCGSVVSVLQLSETFREVTKCGCGRKGKFRLLSNELVDVQRIVIEEDVSELDEAEQPKRLNVILSADLVSPFSTKKVNVGSKVKINGVIKEMPIYKRSGQKSNRFDIILSANYIEPMEEDNSSLVITKEDEEIIISLSQKEDIFDILISKLAPTIYGHERLKEGVLLQLFGGVRKKLKDGTSKRGDIHILLVGDPSIGKSHLMQRIAQIAPKKRFISGKGMTAAGITATVVKDEFLSGYALEAGAIVMAHKGILLADELDKARPEDLDALHTALEQQIVPISKANIQAELKCQTSLLAAANPKFGRYDENSYIADQLEFIATLLNRFDLIYILKDVQDNDSDDKMASFVLDTYRNEDKPQEEGVLTDALLKKYIAYAKKNIQPKISDSAYENMRKTYVKLRGICDKSGVKNVPFNVRYLEGMIRLATASAKVRLSKTIEEQDANRAINLIEYVLSKIGVDMNTGKIDVDIIHTGLSGSDRTHHTLVLDWIMDKTKSASDKLIDHEEIKAAFPKINNIDRIIDRLKKEREIFEPKPGRYKLL